MGRGSAAYDGKLFVVNGHAYPTRAPLEVV
jgi:hypothetical protein